MITQKNVEDKIKTIRDVQVMLDKDLAAFYEVTPTRLREQVKRNANRFPSDFVFHLTDIEVEKLVSQNAIPSKKILGGFLPYVFIHWGSLKEQMAPIKHMFFFFISLSVGDSLRPWLKFQRKIRIRLY